MVLKNNITHQSIDPDVKIALWVYSIACVIFIPFIVIFNLLTIITICVFRRLQTIQSFIVGNMALNCLLVGLIYNTTRAIAQIPGIHVRAHVRMTEYVCISYLLPVTLFVGFGTSFNLVLITGDRFFAIMYPFKYEQVMSVQKVRRITIAFWILSTLGLCSMYVWNDYTPEHCSIFITYPLWFRYIIFFIYSLNILSSTALNAIILSAVYKHRKKQKSLNLKHMWTHEQLLANKQAQKRSKLAISIYFSSVVFLIPSVASNLALAFFINPNSKHPLIAFIGTMILQQFYFISTSLLHVLIKTESREAIRLLLTTSPCRWSELKFHTFRDDRSSLSTNVTTLPHVRQNRRSTQSSLGAINCCPVTRQPLDTTNGPFIDADDRVFSRPSKTLVGKDTHSSQRLGVSFIISDTSTADSDIARAELTDPPSPSPSLTSAEFSGPEADTDTRSSHLW